MLLCVTRDVSTEAGSGQVTDQMRSDPFINKTVLILDFGIFSEQIMLHARLVITLHNCRLYCSIPHL